jgi:hypothetical protein
VLLEDTETAHEKALLALQGTHTAERDRAVALLSQLRAEQMRELSGLKSQHEENVRTALEFQKDRLTSEFKGPCRTYLQRAFTAVLFCSCDGQMDFTVPLVNSCTVTNVSSAKSFLILSLPLQLETLERAMTSLTDAERTAAQKQVEREEGLRATLTADFKVGEMSDIYYL